MAVTYNTATVAPGFIYRATSGGTVFSSNYNATAVFDYFANDAVVDDCLYIGRYNNQMFSDVTFNIGTAIVADSITIVWEYKNKDNTWHTIPNSQDDTVSFSVTGSQAFKFGLPWEWTGYGAVATVNSQVASWIRVRITAVTNITEGGANQTSTVTLADSKVNINDYTDLSPCTLTIIYNYLTTNYAYLNITKTASGHFDFHAVSLYANSRLKVTNQSFEQGLNSGSYCGGKCSMNYLQMGDKIDDDFGKNGAVLWLWYIANSYGVTFSSNTLIYGSTVISTTGAGYPGWNGEWIDSDIQGVNFSGGTGTINNCRFLDAGTFICGSFPSAFTNNKIIVVGTMFGYFYNTNVTIPSPSFGFSAGTHYIIFMYQTAANPTFTFTNPDPPLPAIGDTNKPVYRYATVPASTFAQVWYYDASEGTYTDYTTEFSDAVADDAPLYGDVGDIYYFGQAAAWWCHCWQITTNLASNDYVYLHEYYGASAWWEHSPVHDGAANFTTNGGFMWFGKDNSPTYTSLNVNGYTGYWHRMTITTKGTGSPAISRLLYSNQTGASGWNVYEKFSLDIHVTDEDGTALIGADIVIDLDGVNIYTGVTDGSGDMTQQTLTYRNWFFDPINSYSNFQQVGETTYNAYDLTISYAGKRTYKDKITMSEKKDYSIALDTGDTTLIDCQLLGNVTIY